MVIHDWFNATERGYMDTMFYCVTRPDRMYTSVSASNDHRRYLTNIKLCERGRLSIPSTL